MAIPVSDLKIGSVVRLISGSPKFVVERIPANNQVQLLGWSERLGFVSKLVNPELLTWPRSADPRPTADDPADDEAER